MKKLILKLMLMCVMISCMPVSAGEFKVYSSKSYEQLMRLNGPSIISINGEAVMLLVDFSGSMGHWLPEARETLGYILPKVPYKSAVGLRVFGESSRQEGEQVEACKASRLVTSFKRNNQDKISEGLTTTNLGGLTPLVYGLQQTIDEDLKNVNVFDSNTTRKKKKIILVTDGGENCGGDPCAYIREVMQRRKDIKIDVIQLGNSEKLACLAEATGGTFHKVDGSKQKFETAFENSFNVPAGTVSRAKNFDSKKANTGSLNVRSYNEKIIRPKRIKKCANKQPLASNYKFVNYND